MCSSAQSIIHDPIPFDPIRFYPVILLIWNNILFTYPLFAYHIRALPGSAPFQPFTTIVFFFLCLFASKPE